MADLVFRTLLADLVTPVRAYAALRAQSLGRSSFLFESVAHGEGSGRFSVLGYRARGEALYPGFGDALALMAQELAELATTPPSPPPGPPAAVLAATVARSLIGYIAYDAVHHMRPMEPWPDENSLARMMREPTVVVFDHVDATLTIAGVSKNAVDRCEWEMTHGPEVGPLPLPDPNAEPEYVEVSLDDAMYGARVARAKEHVRKGEAGPIVLARSFTTSRREAEPLDAYRALRMLSPSSHLYFLDFTEMPMAEGLTLVGASPETMVRMEGGRVTPGAAEAGLAVSAIDAVRAAFPVEGVTGVPKARAVELIRALEPSSRDLYGGAVGYISPDGDVDLALASRTIVLRSGELRTTAGASIVETSDPEAAARETRVRAREALAAMRAAQDAAVARDVAAEAKRKRADEKAEAKAKADAAAAEGAKPSSEG